MQITHELVQLCQQLATCTTPLMPNLNFTPNKVSCFNGETTIIANLKHDLNFAVNARQFVEATKATIGGTLTHDQNRVLITTKTGKFKIASYDVTEPPAPLTGELHNMPTTAFELARIASKACGKDDLRPVLTGVHFTTNEIAATDAHRLIVLETNTPFSGITLPATAIPFLNLFPSSTAKVTMSEGKIQVETFEAIIQVRCITGNYPNYSAIIPTAEPALVVSITDIPSLINQIKRLALFADNTSSRIVFDFQNGQFHAEDIDFGKDCSEKFAFDAPIHDLKIAFNAKYLLQMLQSIENSSLKMQFYAANRPLVTTFTGGTQLLMPVLAE